jgi:hypothetical protein
MTDKPELPDVNTLGMRGRRPARGPLPAGTSSVYAETYGKNRVVNLPIEDIYAELRAVNAQRQMAASFYNAGLALQGRPVSGAGTSVEQYNATNLLPGLTMPAGLTMDPQLGLPVNAQGAPVGSSGKPLYSPTSIGIPPDYKGGKVGPNGEALPPGATAFDKNGYPIYGAPAPRDAKLSALIRNDWDRWWEGLKNKWHNTMTGNELESPDYEPANFSRPFGVLSDLFQKPPAEVWAEFRANPMAAIFGSVIGEGTILGEPIQGISNSLSNAKETPSVFQGPVRFASALVGAVFDAFQIPAIAVERTVGTFEGIVGKPEITVGGITYQEAVAPVSAEEAYISSRIAYTTLFNDAKAVDMVSRWQAGEDPTLLQAELENPAMEMIFQMIFDPLNLLGGGAAAKFTKAGRIVNWLPEVRDAFAAINRATDAITRAEAIKTAAGLIRKAARGAADDYEKITTSHGFLGKIAHSKRDAVTRQAKDLFINLVQDTDGDELRLYEAIKNMAYVANPATDAATVSRAIAALANDTKAGAHILSPRGFEAAQFITDWLTDESGIISPSRMATIAHDVRTAQNAMKAGARISIKGVGGKLTEITPTEWLVTRFNDVMEMQAELSFPTILDQTGYIEKGSGAVHVGYIQQVADMKAKGQAIPRWLRRFEDKKIHPWMDKLAHGHLFTQEKAYGPINGFLSDIFMGLNPGYPVRNLSSNYIMMLFDAPGALIQELVPRWKTLDHNAGRAKAIVGTSLPERAIAVISGPAQDFQRRSQKFGYSLAATGQITVPFTRGKKLRIMSGEMQAGLRIWTHRFLKDFDKGTKAALRAERGLLANSQLSSESIRLLERLWVQNEGDAVKTMKAFLSQDPSARRLLNLSESSEATLRAHPDIQVEVYDAWATAKNEVEYETRLRKLLGDTDAHTEAAAAEEAILTKENPFYDDVMEEMAEEGVVIDPKDPWRKDVISRQMIENEAAFLQYNQASQGLVNKVIHEAANRLPADRDKVYAEATRLQTRAQARVTSISDIVGKLHTESLALAKKLNLEALERQDWAAKTKAWVDHRARRVELYRRRRDAIFQVYDKMANDLRAMDEGVRTSVDSFGEFGQAQARGRATRAWDHIDEGHMRQTGHVFPSEVGNRARNAFSEAGIATHEEQWVTLADGTKRLGRPYGNEYLVSIANRIPQEGVNAFGIDELIDGRKMEPARVKQLREAIDRYQLEVVANKAKVLPERVKAVVSASTPDELFDAVRDVGYRIEWGEGSIIDRELKFTINLADEPEAVYTMEKGKERLAELNEFIGSEEFAQVVDTEKALLLDEQAKLREAINNPINQRPTIFLRNELKNAPMAEVRAELLAETSHVLETLAPGIRTSIDKIMGVPQLKAGKAVTLASDVVTVPKKWTGTHVSSNLESLKTGFEQRELGISVARSPAEEVSSPRLVEPVGTKGKVNVEVSGSGLDYSNSVHRDFIHSIADKTPAGQQRDVYTISELKRLGVDWVDGWNGVGTSEELHVLSADAIRIPGRGTIPTANPEEIFDGIVTEYFAHREDFASGRIVPKTAEELEAGQISSYLADLPQATQQKLYKWFEQWLAKPKNQAASSDLKAMAGVTASDVVEIEPDIEKVMKPLLTLDSESSTPAAMIARQARGRKALIEELIAKGKAEWASRDTPPPVVDTKSLSHWAEVMGQHGAEIRATSMETASQARDFALHNYADKYGFDLVLSMIYPYHFWYGRTYKKMIQRAARNPGILAAYAKYRAFLDKQHAGLPDWWKHQLNSNELLGLDSENPLYFNLESLLNPINGITGTDFSDEDRRQTWLGSVFDSMGKLGPTPWLPFQMAVGMTAYLTNHPEEADAYLGSRILPQGQFIKSLTLGIPGAPPGGIEIDPAVMMFPAAGRGFASMDRWEARRVGRLGLAPLVADQTISEAQADDAAHLQSGPIWDMAVRRAAEQRQLTNFTSFFGAGVKARSQTEIGIDTAYEQINYLVARRPDMPKDEYRQAWTQLHRQFPYMESLLLSRKANRENDEAYVWNIMARIPPGQQRDYADLVGLMPELMDQFYEDKGDMRAWSAADRNSLMGGIESLGAILNIPPDALRAEWDQARSHYAVLFDETPDEVEAMADSYYGYIEEKEYDTARAFLKSLPELQQYLQAREQAIFTDPILQKFYGGLQFIEGSWKRQMNAQAALIFGEDILDIQAVYFEIGKRGGDQRSFLAQHPQLAGPYGQWDNGYWGWLHQAKPELGAKLEQISVYLPDTPMANIRPDYVEAGIVAQNALEGLHEVIGAQDAEREALIESYTSAPRDDNYSVSSYIDTEGEKRWPGVVAEDQEWRRLVIENPLAAKTYLAGNPNLRAFRAFENDTRKAYNRAVADGRITNPTELAQGLTWEDWKQVLNPTGTTEYVSRSVADYFRGREMTPDLRKHLLGLWRQMGSPLGSFEAWLAQMKESWNGGY